MARMIWKYEAVGRTIFARYSDGTSKLVATAEFDDYGFSYEQAILHAEVIANALNKTILSLVKIGV